MISSMKKGLPLVSLVAVPVAQAQDALAMDTAAQASVGTVKSSTSAPEPQQEKQVEDRQREVAALKAEVGADQSRSDLREYVSEVDSHLDWP